MSTFVLVHGAWHGSWCWKRVRSALQAEGHSVFTPTLTGLAERSHLLSPDVDLNTHIEDVSNLIRWEDLSDVVLCGHSYGGAVVTGVADRMSDRVHALVFLDAFVPENGENVLQHVPSDQAAQMAKLTEEIGDGWKIPPIPAEVFKLNQRDNDWVNRQSTMQPIKTFQQPLVLTGGIDNVDNVTYIRATGFDEGSPFPPFFDKAQKKGWHTLTMDCGHDVMLDLPEELCKTLLSVA
jgi:pimeloyl-ACP methyl ester carboxylesterase